jgi:hypothetical protein
VGGLVGRADESETWAHNITSYMRCISRKTERVEGRGIGFRETYSVGRRHRACALPLRRRRCRLSLTPPLPPSLPPSFLRSLPAHGCAKKGYDKDDTIISASTQCMLNLIDSR